MIGNEIEEEKGKKKKAWVFPPNDNRRSKGRLYNLVAWAVPPLTNMVELPVIPKTVQIKSISLYHANVCRGGISLGAIKRVHAVFILAPKVSVVALVVVVEEEEPLVALLLCCWWCCCCCCCCCLDDDWKDRLFGNFLQAIILLWWLKLPLIFNETHDRRCPHHLHGSSEFHFWASLTADEVLMLLRLMLQVMVQVPRLSKEACEIRPPKACACANVPNRIEEDKEVAVEDAACFHKDIMIG
jgi:hypothetical protein